MRISSDINRTFVRGELSPCADGSTIVFIIRNVHVFRFLVESGHRVFIRVEKLSLR